MVNNVKRTQNMRKNYTGIKLRINMRERSKSKKIIRRLISGGVYTFTTASIELLRFKNYIGPLLHSN
jgi:hypothetical protein